MTARTLAGLEMLDRLFRRMVYLGCILTVIGVLIGLLLSDAAEAMVISFSIGVGAMTTWAGLRGHKKTATSLQRLKANSP